MEMLARAVQCSNALSPMLLTLFGMEMLVRAAQPANADSPMLVTMSGIEYAPGFAAGKRIKLVFVLLNKTPSKLE
jgi:hypothetical protein